MISCLAMADQVTSLLLRVATAVAADGDPTHTQNNSAADIGKGALDACRAILQLGGTDTLPDDILDRMPDQEAEPELYAAKLAYAQHVAQHDNLGLVIQQQPVKMLAALEATLRHLLHNPAAAAAAAAADEDTKELLPQFACKVSGALRRLQTSGGPKTPLEAVEPSRELLSLLLTHCKVASSVTATPEYLPQALEVANAVALTAKEVIWRFVGNFGKMLRNRSATTSSSSSSSSDDRNSSPASSSSSSAAAAVSDVSPWLVLFGRAMVAYGAALQAAVAHERSRLLRQAIAQDADESVLDSSFTEGLCLCFESCNLLVHDLQQPYKSMRKETQNAILQALKQLNDSLHGIERALAMAAQHVGLANASEDDRHLWDVRPGFNWDKAKQTAELYIQKAVAAVTQVAADMQAFGQVACAQLPLNLGFCNNPQCSNMTGTSELEVAAGVGRCSGCKQAKYCSVDCQKQHWKRHKPVCQQLQKQNSAQQ